MRVVLDGGTMPTLPDDDREGVEWAVEQVRLLAPMADYPLELEVPFEFTGPDFTPIPGRLDVQCGPVVFDLKWRWSDYTAQMAAYAMRPLIAGHAVATVHLLFAESKRVQTLRFTREEAEGIVFPIVERAKADGPQVPGEFCGWCSKRESCSALLARANAVTAGRPDWSLSTYHPSEIKDAAEMGKALAMARAVKEWAESVEYHAKELAVRDGIVPAGYKLTTKQGNRFITSVSDAFPLAGLPQSDFLGACEVKLSALVERYAAMHGLKKAAAEREVEGKLGELIQRKQSTVSLTKERTK